MGVKQLYMSNGCNNILGVKCVQNYFKCQNILG